MNLEPAVSSVTRSKAARSSRQAFARPLFYDLPELRDVHDSLWRLIRAQAPALRRLPEHLCRDAGAEWEGAVFGQVCGYRYATQLADRVALVATPRYKAKGADGPFVRSAVLVRARDPAGGLVDLRGRSLALEAGDLNSINLLRAEAAQLALGGRFFGPLQSRGSFAAVAEAVAEGETDAALLDGVAYALLERLRPSLTKQLRVLLWTTRSPGHPIVAGPGLDAKGVEQVRRALTDVAASTAFVPIREALLITGFNFLPKPQYRAVVHLEQIAQSQDYGRLA